LIWFNNERLIIKSDSLSHFSEGFYVSLLRVILQFQNNRRKSREKKMHHLDFLAAMAFSQLFFLDPNFAVISSTQSDLREISKQNQIHCQRILYCYHLTMELKLMVTHRHHAQICVKHKTWRSKAKQNETISPP
jgi:hypothetical protein